MASYNHVRVYEDDALTFRGLITGYISTSTHDRLNEAGYFTITVPADEPMVSILQRNYIVNFRRSNLSADIRDSNTTAKTHNIFTGVYRGAVRSTGEDGFEIVTLHGYGGLGLLKHAIDAIYNESRTGATQDIIGDLFDDNVSDYLVASTPADRLRNRPLENTVVQPGQTALTGGLSGSNVTFDTKYRTIYEVVQELLAVDNAWTDVGLDDFFFPGRIRFMLKPYNYADASANIHFRIGVNASSISLDTRRIDDETAAIVGGAGQGASKTLSVVEGDNYNVDTNNREIFIDARTTEDASILTDIGDIYLSSQQVQDIISADTIEIAAAQWKPNTVSGPFTYGFRIGDLVSIVYNDTVYTRQISAITWTDEYTDGEKIELEFSNVPS